MGDSWGIAGQEGLQEEKPSEGGGVCDQQSQCVEDAKEESEFQ